MPSNNKKIEPAIIVENVSKTFKIPLEGNNNLKQKIVNGIKQKKGYREFTPVDHISFTINKGDFFGIVGRNGSGKSTLLKTIAGIYSPTTGSVTVNGSLVPFIELGVGFNPELTGRENVFLNGALLGFSRREMENMYDEIVDFAELRDFMEEQLKNYSSGMQVRLAFSVAIQAKGDILLLDEVLAVGDTAFQQKCYDYFASLKSNSKTVILVSHSMSAIERFCSKALLLESGKIKKIGDSGEIATLYENLFLDDANKNTEQQQKKPNKVSNFNVHAEILQNNKSAKGIEALKPFTIKTSIKSQIKIDQLNVGINIRNSQGEIVFSQDMRKLHNVIKLIPNHEIWVEFNIDNYYTNGTYYVDVILVDEGAMFDKALYMNDSIATFQVFGVRDHIHSLFHPPVHVKSSIDVS